MQGAAGAVVMAPVSEPLELTSEATAGEVLLRLGVVPEGAQVDARALSGGISNIVLAASWPGCRAVLKQSGVEQVIGATYERIDGSGLHLTVDGEPRLLEVDDVVVCAGQESVRSLYDEIVERDPERTVHLIGGADVAAELDAKRAIEQGMRVAAEA